MRRLAILVAFISIALLLTIGIAALTQLSHPVSFAIAAVCCLLLYLMLDFRPRGRSGDETIIRLTRGSWYRRPK